MKRHDFDPISAFFGIIFGGAALAVTLADDRVFDLDGRWVWPLILIMAGLAMVATGMRRRDG